MVGAVGVVGDAVVGDDVGFVGSAFDENVRMSFDLILVAVLFLWGWC